MKFLFHRLSASQCDYKMTLIFVTFMYELNNHSQQEINEDYKCYTMTPCWELNPILEVEIIFHVLSDRQ